MSKKFVRSTKDVRDIEKISQNFIEENDIVSTTDGSVYIATKDGFLELGGSGLDTVKTDITTLKSENTKLKNRVTTLETENTNLKSSVETLETENTNLKSSVETLETENTNLKSSVTTLETDYQTLSDRVTALETPAPTE